MDNEQANTWRQGVRDALSQIRKELQKSEEAMDACLDLKDYKGTAQWQTRGEALKSGIEKVEFLLTQPPPVPPNEED